MTIRFLESDDAWHKLIEYLRENTPLRVLNSIEASEVFRRLKQLGYRIAEPEKHPSGLETTEAATTMLVPRHEHGAHSCRREGQAISRPVSINTMRPATVGRRRQ